MSHLAEGKEPRRVCLTDAEGRVIAFTCGTLGEPERVSRDDSEFVEFAVSHHGMTLAARVPADPPSPLKCEIFPDGLIRGKLPDGGFWSIEWLGAEGDRQALTFGTELDELAAEIEAGEANEETKEARRAAAGLSPNQWDILQTAATQPEGTLQIHDPSLVSVCRELTDLGLGRYLPPARVGERASFAISNEGQRIIDPR